MRAWATDVDFTACAEDWHHSAPGYVPVWAIPVHVTNPDEARVLADLEVALREAHALRAPWRVRAAFIAGTATVLDALGEVSDA